MEHKPYRPKGSADRPQRILIVGHSHHKQEHEEDFEDFTIDTVERAKNGEMQRVPFFARQPRYLGLERKQYYDLCFNACDVVASLGNSIGAIVDACLAHYRDQVDA